MLTLSLLTLFLLLLPTPRDDSPLPPLVAWFSFVLAIRFRLPVTTPGASDIDPFKYVREGRRRRFEGKGARTGRASRCRRSYVDEVELVVVVVDGLEIGLEVRRMPEASQGARQCGVVWFGRYEREEMMMSEWLRAGDLFGSSGALFG